MTTATSIWILLLIAFVAANLPWLNGRIFFVITPKTGKKSVGWRLLEWLLLYFVIGFIALGMERNSMGEIHHQAWEFYAVTLCLFAVFAIPGFIYRYNLKQMWARP